MSKEEFLKSLEEKLHAKVNKEEIASLIEYYEGYIEEATDFGMSEEAIIEQIGDIDALVDNLTRGLKNENIDINTRELMVIENHAQMIDIDVRETKVQVMYHDEDKISAKVDPRYKQDYLIKNEDDVLSIKQVKRSLYDFDSMISNMFGQKSRDLYLLLPRDWKITVNICTSNAKIVFDGEKNEWLEHVKLETSNAKIEIKDLKGNQLEAKTSNSKIVLEEVEIKECELKTSNAKIEIEEGKSHYLQAKTSNAKIILQKHDVDIARLKTRNSKIECRFNKNDREKEIYYHTSNGYVEIDHHRFEKEGVEYIPGSEPKITLNLETSNSKIVVENNL